MSDLVGNPERPVFSERGSNDSENDSDLLQEGGMITIEPRHEDPVFEDDKKAETSIRSSSLKFQIKN